jgi:hypothetical protein
MIFCGYRSALLIFSRLPLGLILKIISHFSDRPKQLLPDHAAATAVSSILGPVPGEISGYF